MVPLRVVDYALLEVRTPIPSTRTQSPTRESLSTEGGFLEAWAQGYNVGSLIILILIVFCNHRSGILLHKHILFELVLALWHGTFTFVENPNYGWYLSSTAALLFVSYQIHNVVSWLKIRPFLPLWGSRLFIFSLLAVQPFWITKAWSNFEYFNGLGSDVNHLSVSKDQVKVRSHASMRVHFDCISSYGRRSQRGADYDSIWDQSILAFFALVFKCASDTIFLDDFKSVLDDIIARKLSSTGGGTVHNGTHHGHDTRKRCCSSMRGDPALIECASIPEPVLGTTVEKSYRRPKWLKSFNPFESSEQKEIMPTIRVQRETMVTSDVRKPSHESWHSEQGLLRTPEAAAVGGHRHDDHVVTSALSTGRPTFTQKGYEMK
ncbi:hypothetical protein PMIN03_001372 [Paraphaeosphaeria minitans]|uniref:Uncharacterized protein n=1 Tax=Paraphaeosphaeria minitans TaxID=565426 RepID=A0A9P6GTE2_9PLEO|nr:hypothetical protein PMIN01_01046 [Paraphaeosphaeria minitans]